MFLDKAKIYQGIKKDMTCKKEGHQNRLIEFVCLAPNCSSRLLCTNCLLNDHSDHFKDIVLLEIFIKQENNQNDNSQNEEKPKEKNKENNQTTQEIKQEISKLLSTIQIEDFLQSYNVSKNQDCEQLKLVENKFEEQEKINQEKTTGFIVSVEQFYNDTFNEIKSTYTSYQQNFSNVQTLKLDTKDKLKQYLEDYCKGEINFTLANPVSKLKNLYKLLFYLSIPNLNFIKQHDITEFDKFKEEIDKMDYDKQFENFQIFAFHRAHILKPEIQGNLKELHQKNSLLTTHKKSIYQVLLLEDKKRFVTGSDDTTIQVWTLDKMEVIATLSGHTERIWKLVQASSTTLLSSSNDQKIKLWSLTNYTCLHTFTGHTHWVCTMILLSPSIFISGSQDKTLRVWDLNKKQLKHTIKNEKLQKIMCAIVVPGGGLVVGSDKDIIHCELQPVIKQGLFIPIRSFYGHSMLLRDVQLTKDFNHLISASDDKTVKVWNWQTGDLIRTISGHTLSSNMILQLNERCIVTCSDDQTLKVWDYLEGMLVTTLSGHTSWVICIEIFDSDKLVSVSADKCLKIWSSKYGE